MNSLLRIRRPFSFGVSKLQFFCTSLSKAEEEEGLSCTGIGTKPSFIHPSSVVHPEAVLGQGVSIGPFCTVGPSVKLGNACKLCPGSHVSGHTELGNDCILMMGAIVGDDLPGTECFLEIGDNNEIREHASIHRSSRPSDRTVIGNNNLIMGSCHIAHDCKVGNNNIFANNTLLAGHVTVEDYTHTAGASVIHQFCHIGSFSFIGGGSVVSQDVPRYAMVSGERAELRGLNLEGLRRRGFSFLEIKSLRAAYRKIFMPSDGNMRSFEERLTELEKDAELNQVSAVCYMVKSIRDSFAKERRGICKYRSWSGS